jgi:hypothetical protein
MPQILLILLTTVLVTSTAFAEASVQFAMPGVQAPKDPDVRGLRFVFLHGANDSVGGLDLGLVSVSEVVERSGFSMVMGLSRVSGTSSGCSTSLINVHTGTDSGLNAAFINIVDTLESGLNVGFVNITENSSAVDIGGLSVSNRSKVQLGFVNVTEEITGLQIGFLNFASNGFFPVFPIFNFPRN